MRPIPTLRRFDIYVRLTAGGVASGARVWFCKQGATANLPADLILNPGNTATLNVYFTGAIAVGDWVVVDGNSNNYLVVNAVDTPNKQIGVTCGSIGLMVGQHSRLTPVVAASKAPTAVICNDPLGLVVATQPLTVDNYGRAATYVKDYRYDYYIDLITGETNRVFADQEGSFVMRT